MDSGVEVNISLKLKYSGKPVSGLIVPVAPCCSSIVFCSGDMNAIRESPKRPPVLLGEEGLPVNEMLFDFE